MSAFHRRARSGLPANAAESSSFAGDAAMRHRPRSVSLPNFAFTAPASCRDGVRTTSQHVVVPTRPSRVSVPGAFWSGPTRTNTQDWMIVQVVAQGRQKKPGGGPGLIGLEVAISSSLSGQLWYQATNPCRTSRTAVKLIPATALRLLPVRVVVSGSTVYPPSGRALLRRQSSWMETAPTDIPVNAGATQQHLTVT
jgi:hypothetical protein